MCRIMPKRASVRAPVYIICVRPSIFMIRITSDVLSVCVCVCVQSNFQVAIFFFITNVRAHAAADMTCKCIIIL